MAIGHRATGRVTPKLGTVALLEESGLVFVAEIVEIRDDGVLLAWGDCERLIPYDDDCGGSLLVYGGYKDGRPLVGKHFPSVDEAMAEVMECPIRR